MATVRADQIQVGDVINYRGARAEVVGAWSDETKSPIRRAVVGVEIAWTVVRADGSVEPARTSLTWPDWTTEERHALARMEKSDREDSIKKRLAADINAKLLHLWQG